VAHNINIQQERNGVRVTITATGGSQTIVDWSRSEVAEVVRGLCKQARLPEPWTGR
jgi:hypothetical protein